MITIIQKRTVSIFILILLCLLISCIKQIEQPAQSDPNVMINVPQSNGTPVLLDGIFSQGEWDDALITSLSDSVTMHIKKYRNHLFIGFKCTDISGEMTDMFISVDSNLTYQFHVSAQLGERILTPENISDEGAFEWGKTSEWYANEQRWNNARQRELIQEGIDENEAFEQAMYQSDGVEFQFKLSKFNVDSVKFRIELAWMPTYDKPLVFPTGTTRGNTEGWTTLVF